MVLFHSDLTATSLASCILTIMVIAAREHDINIEGTEASVYKHMVNGPRRIEKIEVHIVMSANNFSNKAQIPKRSKNSLSNKG